MPPVPDLDMLIRPLALLVLASPAGAQELCITARIDGTDELFLGAREARWTHHTWQWPAAVEIGAREWNPRERPHWELPEGEAFFPLDRDLAGVALEVVRARGEVSFAPVEGGFRIGFDDSGAHGDDLFEVRITFADELLAEPVEPVVEVPAAQETRIAILASIDGVDELHLSGRRAAWIHQAWSWPERVTLNDLPWTPAEEPVLDGEFFPPGVDVERARLEVVSARGGVRLERGGGRLFLTFDDGPHFGGADYEVELTLPPSESPPPPRIPAGRLHRVELRHSRPVEVAGAPLSVEVFSPLEGRYVLYPGLRGMAFDGRCVLALPAGRYRFEVQNLPQPDLLVSLRTGPVEVEESRALELPATEPSRPLLLSEKGDEVPLCAWALRSMRPTGEVGWSASEGAPRVVISPGSRYRVRALGALDERFYAWWGEVEGDGPPVLRVSEEHAIRCSFHARPELPSTDHATASLRFPNGGLSLPIDDSTRLFTNRRFIELGYAHRLPDGRRVRFHHRPVILPAAPSKRTFVFGGPLTAHAWARVIVNEDLGRPNARQLWTEVSLIDSQGHVLDLAASEVDWRAEVRSREDWPLPEPPLDDEAVALLGDPTQSLDLLLRYRWLEDHELTLTFAETVPVEHGRFRTLVPAYLEDRAHAYLGKAQRVYRFIEEFRGKRGGPDHSIELKWWLHPGGAVAAFGSITMPVRAMTEVWDDYDLPWALTHEMLHAFGYPHGPELDRVDGGAKALFTRWRWRMEDDPGRLPSTP